VHRPSRALQWTSRPPRAVAHGGIPAAAVRQSPVRPPLVRAHHRPRGRGGHHPRLQLVPGTPFGDRQSDSATDRALSFEMMLGLVRVFSLLDTARAARTSSPTPRMEAALAGVSI